MGEELGPRSAPPAAPDRCVRLFRQREGRPPLTSLAGLSAVRASVVFLAVVVVGALVRVFQDIVSPLVVATFLLLLIDSLSQDLNSRFPRVPRLLRGAVAGSLIIAGFTAVILLIVFQGPPFASQIAGIEPHVNTLIAQVTAMAGQPAMTVRDIFRGASPTAVFTSVFATARGAITYAALVMIYLGFLLASRQEFSAKMDQLYDTEHHREQARRVFDSIRNAVEQYVRLVTFKALMISGGGLSRDAGAERAPSALRRVPGLPLGIRADRRRVCGRADPSPRRPLPDRQSGRRFGDHRRRPRRRSVPDRQRAGCRSCRATR